VTRGIPTSTSAGTRVFTGAGESHKRRPFAPSTTCCFGRKLGLASLDARRRHVQGPLQQDYDAHARAVRRRAHRIGPGRSEIFGNSADDYLEVYSQGATEADVKESCKGVWERLHDDWSDPNRVVLTTTDFNAWGGESGHTYTFTRLADGKTNVDLVTVREGKKENSVKAIEANNDRGAAANR
jgi:hypothetical protein